MREQAIAWLAKLRSGATDVDHADFEDWYIADPRHAEAYEAILETWDQTALAAQTPAASHRHPGRRHSRTRIVGIAAAVLLLFVAGSFALTRYPWRSPAPETLLASRIGEIRTIVLDDGSRVTLDTDSVVHVNFDDDQRRLQLERGRARFEVAHDARRPFVVTAGASEVVAHGTVFDIDLRQPRTLVSLLQGSVQVRAASKASDVRRTSTILRPGQQLALGGTAATAQPAAIRSSEIRWPTGMLSFEDARLAEVVASANRYSQTKIVIGDPAAEERRFTGTFKAGDSKQLADMIGTMFELRVERDPNDNLMLASRK
ncbi:FecR family protein [Sphingomonas koreensis]|uniref:FecR family protein n=1 Tax=Sphingomonas koreensis TaxID=93064 RepID=UPI00234EF0EB|nr:FecR domain-containing protein [Sphingomonas koreensis]